MISGLGVLCIMILTFARNAFKRGNMSVTRIKSWSIQNQLMLLWNIVIHADLSLATEVLKMTSLEMGFTLIKRAKRRWHDTPENTSTILGAPLLKFDNMSEKSVVKGQVNTHEQNLMESELSIYSLNVSGMSNAELECFKYTFHSHDIVILPETWNTIDRNIYVDGFTNFHSVRQVLHEQIHQGYGRISICIMNHFQIFHTSP